MDVFSTALNAVLPTFFLIGLGAAADKWLPNLSMETLTRLSVYYLIPALIFNALATTDLSLGSAALLSLAYLLYLIVLSLIAFVGSKGLNPDEKRGLVITTLFGNTGNMGLPITLFAYGQTGLERAVLLLVISLTLMFVVGPTVLAGGNIHLKDRLRDALKLPPIWATVAGILLNTSGLNMPLSLERGVSLLASAAIPIMLLSLGMQMRRSWVWDLGKVAIRTSLFRLLIGPFVAFAVAALLGLSSLDRNVLLLSSAMPTAVTMFVVAVEVKGDYRGVARAVVATTIGSLFVIMGILAVFP